MNKVDSDGFGRKGGKSSCVMGQKFMMVVVHVRWIHGHLHPRTASTSFAVPAGIWSRTGDCRIFSQLQLTSYCCPVDPGGVQEPGTGATLDSMLRPISEDGARRSSKGSTWACSVYYDIERVTEGALHLMRVLRHADLADSDARQRPTH